MKSSDPKLKAHLFVCTNGPQVEGRCGHKNSENLRNKLKTQCKNESWGQQVRINSSGCLGHCEQGIAAVLYPEGQWHFNLTENDSEVLFKAVKTALEKHK